jgi:hypothetical protein
LIAGPGKARVLKLVESGIVLDVDRPGRYQLAIRHTPYWQPSLGCVNKAPDGVITLMLPRAGVIRLQFHASANAVLNSLTGSSAKACAG